MYIRKSVLRGMEHNEFMIGKALRFWGGGWHLLEIQYFKRSQAYARVI